MYLNVLFDVFQKEEYLDTYAKQFLVLFTSQQTVSIWHIKGKQYPFIICNHVSVLSYTYRLNANQ